MAKLLKNFEQRRVRTKSTEETLGIPKEGFYDPNAEFPRYDYKDNSSINKAAVGTTTNELSIGGGDPNAAIDVSAIRSSVYPHNNVQETAAGHIIEIDDTVGNERVMIKHTSGAGVECRADGSVIITAVKNVVQVTGGNQSVIVEGNGALVYKGNLDLHVQGDLNMKVGGNYNLEVGGDKTETVKHSSTTTIIQDESTTIKGSRTTQIEDNETKTVRGSITESVQVDYSFNVGNDYTLVVKEAMVVDADEIDQSYNFGTIGGSVVDFTGKTATCTTFHGDLNGTAKAALAANVSAGVGGGGATVTSTGRTYSPSVLSDTDRTTTIATLDVNLKPNTTLPYVNYTPTTAEVRSMLRSPSIAEATTFTDAMILANIISLDFDSTSVTTTGRRSGPKSADQKGTNPLGQNPPTFDVKTFTF